MPEVAALRCPACNSSAVSDRGALPRRAGLVALADPGHLYACCICRLRFRHPYPDDASVTGVYAACPGDTWDNRRRRADFDLLASFLDANLSHGDILDVGCSRGDFLATYLPARFGRFGVEPAADARAAAVSRGIRIVAETVEALPPSGRAFDAICLVDAIEHLRRPFDALARLGRLLAPGGYLLISTGDAEAPLWRILGSEYYYHYNEHVSFLSRPWLEWAAPRLGLTLCASRRFSHNRAPLAVRTREVAACALRLAQRALDAPSRMPGVARRFPFSLCSRVEAFGLAGFRDHIFAAMRAPLRAAADSEECPLTCRY